MFCGCPTTFGAGPNTQTCPVCLGMPGTLPVINRRAIEFGVRTALAFNLTINASCRFARKHYYYPDMPKNFQISQYEEPLAEEGWLDVDVDGTTQRVIPRDFQLDPVRDVPIHVDFMRLGEGATIRVRVPIHIVNADQSPGVKRGGAVNIVTHTLDVRCPADAIPEASDVDVSGL